MRPKSTGRGGRKYNPRARQLRAARAALVDQRPFAAPLVTHVEVELIFSFRRPASHFTAGGSLRPGLAPYYRGTGDADNYAKFVLDALEGVIVANDKQVRSLLVVKKFAEGTVGRTTIIVRDTGVVF